MLPLTGSLDVLVASAVVHRFVGFVHVCNQPDAYQGVLTVDLFPGCKGSNKNACMCV